MKIIPYGHVAVTLVLLKSAVDGCGGLSAVSAIDLATVSDPNGIIATYQHHFPYVMWLAHAGGESSLALLPGDPSAVAVVKMFNTNSHPIGHTWSGTMPQPMGVYATGSVDLLCLSGASGLSILTIEEAG